MLVLKLNGLPTNPTTLLPTLVIGYICFFWPFILKGKTTLRAGSRKILIVSYWSAKSMTS